MKIDELVAKSLSKRPLLREKIKENRRLKAYNKIENLENLIKEKDRLARNILKLNLSGKDVSKYKNSFRVISDEIENLLVENGFSKTYLTNFYYCDKCKDTGYYNNKVCSCIMEDLVNDRIRESGFIGKKREQNFENFNYDLFTGTVEMGDTIKKSKDYMKSLVSFSKDYCDNLKQKDYGLYFFGNSGSGKTYLTSSMVNYMLDKGRRALFITASNFFDLMYNYNYSFYRDKLELQDKIDLIKNIEFLVIDDLGSEAINKNNNSFLSILLDERLESGLNTVISSNLTPFELAEIYDSRVSSRVRGNFKFFPFPTEDLREKINSKRKI